MKGARVFVRERLEILWNEFSDVRRGTDDFQRLHDTLGLSVL